MVYSIAPLLSRSFTVLFKEPVLLFKYKASTNSFMDRGAFKSAFMICSDWALDWALDWASGFNRVGPA